MSRGSGSDNNRIYVGNLPPDIRSKDVEDLFFRFGKVSFVDLKNRRGKYKKVFSWRSFFVVLITKADSIFILENRSAFCICRI